ncbi:hypothetical protein MHB50_02075 [Siminovitchia sp. FSL H7-0308]|uniref:Uncharacterized protein n=1 Tax=Siminovitchia thermophila TaxID=1245522 RepID=A0ABS2R6B6_9BACI|nr:hypothetical protein [Siminovitchia thermophila]MBM7714151.1 hypothetical protein [Siminovitchia thermophila]ONK24744.1 hypothetical protein BLX87_03630 [Bacillus sp. VT-16-64]
MSSYDKLSDQKLASFFVEINKNIKKGKLSKAMNYEIALIQAVADKRGLSKLDLQKLYLKSARYL